VQPKVPTTAAEWAAAHAELATENEALATLLAATTMQLTQETKDKEALATLLAGTTVQLTQETKDKEALATQLAATVLQCANLPAQAVAAGAEGTASTPRASPRSCVPGCSRRTHATRHCCRR
jgi:hypothetical protein